MKNKRYDIINVIGILFGITEILVMPLALINLFFIKSFTLSIALLSINIFILIEIIVINYVIVHNDKVILGVYKRKK